MKGIDVHIHVYTGERKLTMQPRLKDTSRLFGVAMEDPRDAVGCDFVG